MTERDSDLFKMVSQVLEIKQARIDKKKRQLQLNLLDVHLNGDTCQFTKDTVGRLTRELSYLEENKKKFMDSVLFEMGLFIDEARA